MRCTSIKELRINLVLKKALSEQTSLNRAGRLYSVFGMTKHSPFRYFKTSPEVIRLAVMMYVRFPLSLRNVEDLLHERGVDVSHETVRFWWNRFGPMFESLHLHQLPSPQSSGIRPASSSWRSSLFSSPRTRRPTFAAWRWATSLSFRLPPVLQISL